MATSVLSMILETKKRGTGGVEATRELQGVTKGLQSAVLAVGAVAGALVVAQRLYRATVGETMEYADQIRTLSALTGQGATETSRLIQVVDDFGLSADDMTTATRKMREDGLVPSVGALAALSDEFLALPPGVDRADFLLDHFGRSGANLGPLLSQGSEAIREMGRTVSEDLLLTDEDVERWRQWGLTVDDLGDRARGAGIQIANVFLPALEEISGELDRLDERKEVIAWIDQHLEEHGPVVASEIARRGNAIAIYREQMDAALQPTRDEAFAIRDLETAAVGASGELDGLTESMLSEMLQTMGAAEETRALREAIQSLQDRHITVTTSLVEMVSTWQQAQGQVTTSAWHRYNPTVGTSGQRSLDQMQYGGAFDVMGPAGVDRVPVGFMATAGERVTVQTPEQQRRGGRGDLNIYGGLNVYTELDEQILLSKFRRLLT